MGDYNCDAFAGEGDDMSLPRARYVLVTVSVIDMSWRDNKAGEVYKYCK
jgi:hypothetical protein